MKKYTIASLLLAISASANAYEPITHKELSAEAAKKSVLINPMFLSQLGLSAKDISDNGYNLFPTSEGGKQSILEVIRFGADWEDGRGEKIQSTRHFFNPLNGEALSAGPYILPKFPFYIPRINGIRSPDWALEDVAYDAGNLGLPQRFSYRFGRQYFYDALTLPAKADRDDKWGLTFQTLGHVIHHIQDMAQPQHTRNDFHCDKPFCEDSGLLGGVKPSFEKWTLNNEDASQYSGYEPVYTKEATNGFKKPRDFWIGGGKGVAEFSNRNFFTAGTNVGVAGFPSPQVPTGSAQKIDVAFVCAEAVQKGRRACPANLFGNMTFFATNVTDNLRTTQSGNNPRATTRSIFDVDLKKRFFGSEAYSVNRFTYDATNDFTLKRAVGYSAGMINYFFRGDVNLFEDVAQPGTYAIRNSGPDAIRGRFQLCYDYDSPTAADNRACFKTWTDIALDPSGEINVGTFEPPTSPTPKKPGEYMLVFNGDMGGEKATDFGGIGAVTARQVTLNPPLIFYARRDQEDTSQESYGSMEFGMFLTEAMWSAMRSNPRAFTVVAETANQRYEMSASADFYSTECGSVPYKRFIGACASQEGQSTQLNPNGQPVVWQLLMNRNNEFVVTSKFDFTVPILLGNKPEDLATKPIETVCAGLFRYASYLYLNSYTTTGQVKIRLLFQKDATAVKVPLFEFTVAPGSTPVDQTYGANLSGLKGVGRAPVHCGVGLLP